jgi:Undecaprenyl pyrophosphate synthase
LLIRTSGEERISNFMLWQLAYTEMVFDNTYWPDFTSDDLIKDIKIFNDRDRRFGSV